MLQQRTSRLMLSVVTLVTSGLIVLALLFLLKLYTAASAIDGAAHQVQTAILAEPTATCLTTKNVPASECLALVDFFTKTQGIDWLTKTNWLSFTANAPCDWYGVTCRTGRVAALDLPRNGLSGTLPLTLGDLGALVRLRLENNALAGRLPPTLCTLAGGLTDTDLAYNRLWTLRQSVGQCMKAIDPDWQATQTRPVTNLRVTQLTTSTLQLSWTPIPYTADGGYYEIALATAPDGPFVPHGHTIDKSAASYLVDGLTPGHAYYFLVRTYTPAHDEQPNELRSTVVGTVGVTKALSGRVLVAAYFPADNDLASEIPYVLERFRVGTARNPNVQVVLLVDGAKAGDTRVLTLADGKITPTDAVVQQWGVTELDTADPAVLAWFLTYARNRFPATRTVAALLGHGIPPAPEVSWGETTLLQAASQRGGEIPPLPKEHEYTPSDVTDRGYMSTVDVGQALMTATANGSQPFDLLYFDQCFQGNLDILYEVYQTAKVFVASPNYAWLAAAYDKYLAGFTPTATPEEMATMIINRYEFSLNPAHPNAIFWLRSSDIKAIADAVSNLGDALLAATNAGQTNPIATAVRQSKYVDTTQCSRQNLQLGPPDELIGLETFGQNLLSNFGLNDAYGVATALTQLRTAMDGIQKLSRIGNPYLAPEEEWDYRDSITVLAPLPRNARSAVAWRASVYRSETPFSATWTIDPGTPVTVTQSLAYVREGRWDEFLATWFTDLSPTVGEWCNYRPPTQILVDESEPLTLTAALSGTAAVALTWTPADDSSVLDYRIDELGPYAISWVAHETVGITQTAAALTGLAAGRYHLRVFGRNEEAELVAQSNEVVIEVPVAPSTNQQLFLPLVNR